MEAQTKGVAKVDKAKKLLIERKLIDKSSEYDEMSQPPESPKTPRSQSDRAGSPKLPIQHKGCKDNANAKDSLRPGPPGTFDSLANKS